MLKPGGNPVASKEVGLLSAVTWKLSGFPLIATISGLLVITGEGAREKEALKDFPLDPLTLTESVIGLVPVTVTPGSDDSVPSDVRPLRVTVMVPLLLWVGSDTPTEMLL